MTIAVGFAALWPTTAAEHEPLRVTTTVYVGQHSEVRNHDQPVKYVFEGSTRVARVTGALSGNPRVQRLRLRSGWNLVSLAVTAEDLVGQIERGGSGAGPVASALYRPGAMPGAYQQVAAGESVAAGTVLWIKAGVNTVVGITGQYVEPVSRGVPPGGGHVAGPGLEAWALEPLAGMTAWTYESGEWRAGLPEELAMPGGLPPALAPGEAIYAQTDVPVEFEVPDPTLRVAYYHQDHLGSSSVITDADGGVIQDTAYHPYGMPRHEERTRPIETHYAFTQKERDAESRLHYFEARYLFGATGRFISVDPRLSEQRFHSDQAAAEFFANPQRLNHYAYAVNNPLRYIDPKGEDVARPRKAAKTPETPKGTTLELRGIDGAGGASGLDLAIQSFQKDTQRPLSGASGATRGVLDPGGEVVIVSDLGKHSSQLGKMTTQGAHIQEAIITVRGPDPTLGGKERELFRVKLTDVMISSLLVSAGGGKPMEQFTLNARKIEIEQIPAPSGPVPIPYPMRLFFDLATPKK
ncbi:MAG: type VI secretion system tube protein Hcp [Verrucomicrobia bacterium]|nr:type VI secretion system tube protein Hcp [Verrucomicrobiota bacterium]